MTPAEFDAALQACLDARRDPLDDPVLAGHLLQHADALEDFARLRAALAALPREPRPRARRHLPLALLAAGSLAAVGLWLGRPAPAEARAPGYLAAGSLVVEPAPAGTAFHWRVRETVAATPTAELEIVEQWSRRR